MPSMDHDLLVLITNLHGTDRLSSDAFEKLKLFLMNPLYKVGRDDATLWITIGNTVFEEGQYTLAMKCYANAIEIDPVNLDAWNNISLTFDRIGRPDEANRARMKVAEIKVASLGKVLK